MTEEIGQTGEHKRQSIENVNGSPTNSVPIEQEHQKSLSRRGGTISRRRFLKVVPALPAFAAAAAIGSRDVKLPDLPAIEKYLYDNSEALRLVLGSHDLPPGHQEYVSKLYSREGILDLCVWSSASSDIIRSDMKSAKGRGYERFLCLVDGQLPYNVKAKGAPFAQYNWPRLFHPELNKQAEYPNDLYILNPESIINFGLYVSDVVRSSDPIIKQQLIGLMEEVNSWYDPQDIVPGSKAAEKESQAFITGIEKNVLENSLDAVIIGGLIRAGISSKEEISRRTALVRSTLIGLGLGIETVKVLIKTGAFHDFLLGNISDPEWQKRLTVLANSTVQTSYDIDTDIFAETRTAIGVEMALDARAKANDPNTLPRVDLLYGSGHNVDAPQIMTSSEFREGKIRGFIQQHLKKIDEAIQNKYPELRQFRTEILQIAAESLSVYTINKLNVPWGKTSIPPSEISMFEAGVLERKFTGYCNSILAIAREVMSQFNVPPSNFDMINHNRW